MTAPCKDVLMIFFFFLQVGIVIFEQCWHGAVQMIGCRMLSPMTSCLFCTTYTRKTTTKRGLAHSVAFPGRRDAVIWIKCFYRPVCVFHILVLCFLSLPSNLALLPYRGVLRYWKRGVFFLFLFCLKIFWLCWGVSVFFAFAQNGVLFTHSIYHVPQLHLSECIVQICLVYFHWCLNT